MPKPRRKASNLLAPPFLTRVFTPEKVADTSAYPLNVAWLKDGEFDFHFTTPITLICGENGSGKSTFLEAVATHCGFNLTGGSANQLVAQTNHVTALAEKLKFIWKLRFTRGFFFRAESLYNFATYLDDMKEEEGPIAYRPYGGKSLHNQSHGESFISLLRNRMQVPGLYILDEPEAALSPNRQLELLAILHEIHLEGKSQVILASHSPLLLSYPHAELFEVEAGIFTRKTVQHTATYKTYARFLANPDTYFRELFRT